MKRLLAAVLTISCILSLTAGMALVSYGQEEGVPRASVVTSRNDETVVPGEDAFAEDEAFTDRAASVYQGEAQEEPDDINPFTGEAGFNVAALGKRPVAVMINNHPRSFPQYNVSKADVLFEVVVEHGYSRFMGLFADYTNVPYLVSPRSYRYYFPMISTGFDAFYIHWGEDQTMMWYYYDLGLDAYDGLSNSYLFGRDQDRIDAGYDLEHTSAFYGYLLPDQLGWDEKRTDLKEEYLGEVFHFVPYGTVKLPAGEDCSYIDIEFGSEMTSQFVYDAEAGVYRKYANYNPQIDGITGEQLSFPNVLVLYTKIFDRDDEPEADRKFLEVFASLDDDYNTGYYAYGGKLQKIHWTKADEYDRLRFFDEDGQELELNRGRSYIAYTYTDHAQFSQEVPVSMQ